MKAFRLKVSVLVWLTSPVLALAQVANQTAAKADYSNEAFVLERSSDKFKFFKRTRRPSKVHLKSR